VTRPDAEVILVAPIGEVVTAFAARPRMVRDFVGGEASGREAPLRQFEQAAVSSPGMTNSPRAARVRSGTGFDGELVSDR